MRGSRSVGAAAWLLTLAVACSGCGGSESSGPPESVSPPVTIRITESGGSISPDDGRVVEAQPGQMVRLVVTSDVADEIHVHSDPAHEFHVDAGAENEVFTFTVDDPATYAIESHGLEVTVVKLQVS